MPGGVARREQGDVFQATPVCACRLRPRLPLQRPTPPFLGHLGHLARPLNQTRSARFVIHIDGTAEVVVPMTDAPPQAAGLRELFGQPGSLSHARRPPRLLEQLDGPVKVRLMFVTPVPDQPRISEHAHVRWPRDRLCGDKGEGRLQQGDRIIDVPLVGLDVARSRSQLVPQH